MDTERFTLNLTVKDRSATRFDRTILETQPDEIIFAHRFKEVVVEGRSIVVKDRFGEKLFSLKASALA